MKIPEGSSVIIKDKSFNMEESIEAYEDLEIECGSIMMFDGYLCRIDSVKHVIDDTFIIEVYAQDALYIEKGYMKQSIFGSD